MLDYDASLLPADVTIGHDAAYYQPDVPNVAWNDEVQPFGYEGLVELLRRLDEVMA
ncbi:MAG: hypothetical protein LKE50_00685 [Atopobiaceae bacterium]|jgi:nitrogenase molybdenum-cofactor synthesis protein NifE|nr:hypothetical protein [Atopobiaceae bacterium]